MPTEVVKTVKDSGGDYTTLTAWDAGEQRDLVAVDEIAIVEGTGLIVDQAVVDGWATDATRKIIIRTASGDGHGGAFGAGFRIQRTTSAHHQATLEVKEPYTELIGIGVETLGSHWAKGVITAANCTVDSCVFDMPFGVSYFLLYYGASNLVTNNLVRGNLSVEGLEMVAASQALSGVYNNTVVNCRAGIRFQHWPNDVVKNNAFYACTEGIKDSGSTDGGEVVDTNAFNDATGYGANKILSITSAAFTDAAGADYSLSASSVLEEAGLDLSGTFTIDILGAARTSPWSIGAFNNPGGGGGVALNASLESITLTSYSGTVQADVDTSISAALESILLSENAASVQADVDTNISAALEGVLFTANAATVEVGSDTNITGSVESISISEHQAAVQADVDVSISAGQEQIALTAHQASFAAVIEASAEAITLSTFVANVSSDRAINASLETLQVVANPAGVSVGSNFNAAVEAISLSSNQAVVELDTAISANLESIILNELSAQISLGQNINAALESLTLTPNSAVLTLDSGITATLETISLSTLKATISSFSPAPSTAGLEYTLADSRLHYTLPVSRLHFTFRNED